MSGTKYRPINFDQVLGMEHVKVILKSSLKEKDIRKAYLFSGEFSVGKTTVARIFARGILCTSPLSDGSPCNKCPSCEAFLSNRHPGYLEIDAATHGGIEDINKLKEDLTYESLNTYSIILLDECHMISKAGKDALLKELEKPSDNVVFMFCTTEIEKMPNTLRSRCVEFYLPHPSNALVVKKLKSICEQEGIPYKSEDPFHLLARATGGHYRDAENKLVQIKILGEMNKENVKKVIQVQNEEVFELLMNLPTNLKKALEVCNYLTNQVSVQDLYRNVLTILVDSEKRACGFDFGDRDYQTMLETINSNFSGMVPGLLDYLIMKDRISNITSLEADLILIHHKFLKGQFKAPEIKPVVGVKKEDPIKPFSFADLEGKNTHERNSIIRTLKNKPKETKSESAEEELSKLLED